VQTIQLFPSAWKHAIVIIIPKLGKDMTNPVNYHTISLLNTMSKVLEKLLLTRLKIRLDQHGFRSTITQLFRVIDDISPNLNKRRIIAVSCSSLKKSFDKVRHDDLISKRIDLGVPSVSNFSKPNHTGQAWFLNNSNSPLHEHHTHKGSSVEKELIPKELETRNSWNEFFLYLRSLDLLPSKINKKEKEKNLFFDEREQK